MGRVFNIRVQAEKSNNMKNDFFILICLSSWIYQDLQVSGLTIWAIWGRFGSPDGNFNKNWKLYNRLTETDPYNIP